MIQAVLNVPSELEYHLKRGPIVRVASQRTNSCGIGIDLYIRHGFRAESKQNFAICRAYRVVANGSNQKSDHLDHLFVFLIAHSPFFPCSGASEESTAKTFPQNKSGCFRIGSVGRVTRRDYLLHTAGITLNRMIAIVISLNPGGLLHTTWPLRRVDLRRWLCRVSPSILLSPRRGFRPETEERRR